MTDTQAELRSRVYKTVCAHRNSTTPDQFTDMLMKLLLLDGWRETKKELPKKPGLSNYEYVECLIYVRGEIIQRPWNCEHLCWDDAHHDDFEFYPTEPTHWRPLPQPPAQSEGGEVDPAEVEHEMYAMGINPND